MLNQVGTSHCLAAPAQSLPKLIEGSGVHYSAKITSHTKARNHFKVALANYVPRARCGKVWNEPRVPEVQPAVIAVLGRIQRGRQIMSAFEEHKEELEKFEQMFGRDRGRLAVSLDRLTNALVLVGQHGVYCTSQRNPTVPAMDLRIINQELLHAKELVQSVMEEMRLAGKKK
jgi:hypothetical protein